MLYVRAPRVVGKSASLLRERGEKKNSSKTRLPLIAQQSETLPSTVRTDGKQIAKKEKNTEEQRALSRGSAHFPGTGRVSNLLFRLEHFESRSLFSTPSYSHLISISLLVRNKEDLRLASCSTTIRKRKIHTKRRCGKCEVRAGCF